jgi:hypothetical protein
MVALEHLGVFAECVHVESLRHSPHRVAVKECVVLARDISSVSDNAVGVRPTRRSVPSVHRPRHFYSCNYPDRSAGKSVIE